MPASTRGRASFALLALVALVSGLSAVPVHAQEKATIYASVLVSDNSLAGRPVMVSFIRDGGIFFQEETITTESPNVVSVGSQDSPVGVYDVRVEGDGIVTEMKRGVTLAGIDSVMQPFDARMAAWTRLASLFDFAAYADNVEKVALEALPEKAAQILKGAIKGRVVVNPRS